MTNSAQTKAVATPPGEETDHVELSDAEADRIESKWEAQTPTLSGLKTQRKRQLKRRAYDLLRDHYDGWEIRAQRTGDAVPDPVREFQQAVVAVEDQAASEIDAAETKAEVKAVSADWPDPPDPPF
jgi:hypothetical protein